MGVGSCPQVEKTTDRGPSTQTGRLERLHLLCDRSGGKLSTNILKRFDHTDREPPVLPKTMIDLRRLVVHLCNMDPFEDPSSQHPAITNTPSGSQTASQFGIWVYSSQTRSLTYQSSNGISIPQNQWPARRGRARVFLLAERTWRVYDFDRQDWYHDNDNDEDNDG